MSSRKREAICMGIGILAGITLCGPAAQATNEAITAALSTQPIYIDGVQVEMEAYFIHGNNFVKLRDVGEAVGFNVYWDGSAAQPVSPVSAYVWRFAATLWAGRHPYLPANETRCWPRVRQLRQGVDCTSVYKDKDRDFAQEIVAFLITLAAAYGYSNLFMVWCVVAKEACKMRNTLEDLYYGNITPGEQQVAPNSELKKATDRIARFESQLTERLDEAGQAILAKLVESQHEIDSITALENFILGFRLGAKIAMECMDENDGNIKNGG